MPNSSSYGLEWFSAIAVIFLIYELIAFIKKINALKLLHQTGTEEIDNITSKKQGEVFECTGFPIATASSPVTHTPCAWWSFDILQAKLSQRGGAASVPLYAKRCEETWIFLETKNHVLALCSMDSDKVERLASFSWTSMYTDSMPALLNLHLSSASFDPEEQNRAFILTPTVATTYYEEIIPATTPIHVIGNVRHLDNEERSKIEEKLREMKVKKTLLNVTLGGDNYGIGIYNESALRKRIRRHLYLHGFLVIFGIVSLVLAIYQINLKD